MNQEHQIPTYICQEDNLIYIVKFKPDGSGQYNIHVTYNEIEVKGIIILLN